MTPTPDLKLIADMLEELIRLTDEHPIESIRAQIRLLRAADEDEARRVGTGVVSDEPTQHMIEEGVKSLRCDLDLTRRPQTRTAQRAARNLYVTMRAASLAPTQEGGGNERS